MRDTTGEKSAPPAVYVETNHVGSVAETVVKVVWNPACIERQSFGTLAEALAFARSVCEPEDDNTITT